MALGTNYKRSGDRDDKRVEKNLENHFQLMSEFERQGIDRDSASAIALMIVSGHRL